MSLTIQRAEEALDIFREAYGQATAGRRGPVYIGIPVDVQREKIEVPSAPWRIRDAPATYQLDPQLIGRVVGEMAQATCPTLVVGGGVYWSQCQEEVKELAELLGAPFGTTPSQKGVLPEDHPLSLGVLGFGAFPFANKACLESDLVLAIGTTFSEGLTLGYGNRVIPHGIKIIQIDADAAEIGKIYPVHLGIVCDAKAVLQEMVSKIKENGLKKDGRSPRVERIAAEKKAWLEEIARRGKAPDGPITQWHLYHALRQAMSKDSVVVGAGATGELLHRFVAASEVYHSGEFRAIGSGIATAIGLRLAFPKKRVITVSGDGSFMLEMQELATAMALKLPIVIIVIHNSAYGNMKRDQIQHYDKRVIGTDLYLPDLCALAAAFGAYAARVEGPSDLLPALKGALATNKPALLDVLCPIEGI